MTSVILVPVVYRLVHVQLYSINRYYLALNKQTETCRFAV